MCTNIAEVKTFDKKVIRCHTNVPTDVECLALFFATSLHRAWAKLELGYIQDYGFHILYRSLNDSGITITVLKLFDCGLTSASSRFFSDITISFRVKS